MRATINVLKTYIDVLFIIYSKGMIASHFHIYFASNSLKKDFEKCLNFDIILENSVIFSELKCMYATFSLNSNFE